MQWTLTDAGAATAVEEGPVEPQGIYEDGTKRAAERIEVDPWVMWTEFFQLQQHAMSSDRLLVSSFVLSISRLSMSISRMPKLHEVKHRVSMVQQIQISLCAERPDIRRVLKTSGILGIQSELHSASQRYLHVLTRSLSALQGEHHTIPRASGESQSCLALEARLPSFGQAAQPTEATDQQNAGSDKDRDPSPTTARNPSATASGSDFQPEAQQEIHLEAGPVPGAEVNIMRTGGQGKRKIGGPSSS